MLAYASQSIASIELQEEGPVRKGGVFFNLDFYCRQGEK